ncbi:MAG: hypothetical protein A2Y71_14190 [Bacteroidetes bacterium RBG_13_42_15]|nr:MAG: hypothetical protein A2Y71_14190 [Bacteroidetes bacterium RBG_13_42_15]
MTANSDSSLQSSGDAANSNSPKTAGSAKQSCDFHFVEIELVGEDGKGVAGVEYLLELPDGTEISGSTNSLGLIRIDGIDSGNCQITLPKLDKEAWEVLKE